LKGSKKPKICVWNYNKETFIPDHSSYTVLEDFHHRCVVSLDFDVSGKYLGSIGMDDDNSVAIYDWERPEKKLVATSPGSKGKVVMIRFNPHGDGSQFVTCGVKLIRFWQMEKQTGGAFKLTSKNGVFGKYPQQTITCVEFVKGHPNLVLAGANNGEVLLWDKNTLVSSIAAHTGAVFSLIATPSCDAIFTAGKDGKIKKWQITDRARGHISTASKDIAAFGAAQVIRAIDYDDTTKTVAYGTSGGQVGTVSVADTSATTYTAVRLNQGHASELWGLAAHPTQPVFATASVDGSLVLWNAEKRVAIAERRLSTQSLQSASGEDLADESSPVTVLDVPVGAGLGAACLDFSPSGDRLAVGLFYGGIEILDANTLHSIQSMKRPQSRNNLASLSASSVAESHMDALESRGGGTPGPNNSNSNSSSQSSDGTSSPNSSSTLRVQDIKYSPSGQLLAAGLSDGSIHIYNCSSSSLKYLGSCKGHSASVTHLDWSSDSKFIQSSSAAYEYLFWGTTRYSYNHQTL
jgi:WD40 repeat protein